VRCARLGPVRLDYVVPTILGFALLAADPLPAAAHARPPSLNSLLFDRNDPDHIVAQSTWGMAVTRDGGASWQWMCAAVLGVDPRLSDPPMIIGTEGRVLAATFEGLLASDPEGCEWDFFSDALSDTWVVDLEIDPTSATTFLAVATDTRNQDRLYRSIDEGRTWNQWGPSHDEVLMDRVIVAPSDPTRVYISADIPAVPARRTFVLRSDDGGRTHERLEFAGLEPDEHVLRIRAVDPSDAAVLYAAVIHDDPLIGARRLVRSEDGGETFANELREDGLGDVVISDDGGTVFTASRLGGVFRSDDGGMTFERVHANLPVACLALHDDALYACVDDRMAGYALARSMDRGVSWEPLLRLNEIQEMLPCPTCSDVGIECPAWLPDVAFDLGFDPGFPIELDADGGVGLPRDAGLPPECGGPEPPGCTCAAAPVSTARWPLALAWVALVRAWRRGRGQARSRGVGAHGVGCVR